MCNKVLLLLVTINYKLHLFLQGILTVCSMCSDAYHALCHAPRIPERLKAWNQWECNNCLESRPNGAVSPGIIPRNIEQTTTIPPSPDPFLKPHEIERAPTKNQENVPVKQDIPDISNWTCGDVFDYFLEHYPEAAHILKEQVGTALLLLVRDLRLRLSPDF